MISKGLIQWLFLAVFFVSCQPIVKEVDFSNSHIVYQGRIDFRSNAAVFCWPGSSATLFFKGTSISAKLKDLDTANYYNVIIDDTVISKIHTDTLLKSYVLATGLANKPHKVELFKRTEADKGKTLFYGFKSAEGMVILPPTDVKTRKIEFYGNSITCGYAIEDSSGADAWHGYFENNYLTYAAITARHYNAQYSCIAKSGIGILISWFPIIMPEMYDRLNPEDSLSEWNFSNYTPDLVVVNLFQNDSWLVKMPEHDQFKFRFGSTAPDSSAIVESYKKFITTIRNQYPNAKIICALGNMDATKMGSPWPGYIREAIKQLNDAQTYTCFFEYKNSNGHPGLKDQKAMADQLIGFIDQHIKW